MENESVIEVLNNLIKINNDRIAGFSRAGNDVKEDSLGLIATFNKLAAESEQNVAELTSIAQRYGDDIVEGTSTLGDLHRAWIDLKTTFTGNDQLSILNECERGEDAIKDAYRTALDAGNGINPEVAHVLIQQQKGILEGHNLIKSLRDQVRAEEAAEDQKPGFSTFNEPVDQSESQQFNTQPSYERSAGEYPTEIAHTPEPEDIEQEEEWQEGQETTTANSRLMEFFINELKDLLWAERELAETLPDMAEAATSQELRNAFELHQAQTVTHITRLEQVFGILGLEPESRTCEAMSGILDEGDEIISITEEGTAQRDVGLIFAGQKAEHYEIASYGGMIALAKTLGYYEIAETFVLTLDEEKTADAKLTEIAESQANYDASTEPIS